MDQNFPYSIYSKFNGIGNNTETRQQNSTQSDSLDRSVNNIARNIANVVIRTSEGSDEEQHDRGIEGIKLPHIPKEILLFAAVIAAKVLLYATFREAKKQGLEILNL